MNHFLLQLRVSCTFRLLPKNIRSLYSKLASSPSIGFQQLLFHTFSSKILFPNECEFWDFDICSSMLHQLAFERLYGLFRFFLPHARPYRYQGSIV